MDEAQSMPVNEAVKNDDAMSADLMTMAKRELGAFMSVVTELYGSEQAKLSAGDWLEELESLDRLPGLESREWRRVKIAAAARLANCPTEIRQRRAPAQTHGDVASVVQRRRENGTQHFS